MGLPAIGTILLINFPFADLKGAKKRPSVVLSHGSINTVVVCQVTSRNLPGVPGIEISSQDFTEGKLHLKSYARVDKLLTVDPVTSSGSPGTLSHAKVSQIRQSVAELFI